MQNPGGDLTTLYKKFDDLKERHGELENDLHHCRNVISLHQKEIVSLEKSKLKIEKDFDEKLREVDDRLVKADRDSKRRRADAMEKDVSDSGLVWNKRTGSETRPSPSTFPHLADDDDDDDDEDEDEDEDEDGGGGSSGSDEDNGGFKKSQSFPPPVEITGAENKSCKAFSFSSLFAKKPPSKKKIRKRSKLNAFGNTPIRLPRGAIIKVRHYDRDRDMSPYMDCKSGVYEIPLKGKYWFGVFDDAAGVGIVNWYVCTSQGGGNGDGGGGGRRLRINSWWCYGGWNEDGRKLKSGIRHDKVTVDCEEGEKVWVEGEGMERGSMVTQFHFYGMMEEWAED